MIELRHFVTEALKDIFEGVQAAQESAESVGAIVSPIDGNYRARVEPTVDHVLPVEQPARFVREDKVLILPVIAEPQLPPLLRCAMPVECADGPLAQRDRAVAAGLSRPDDLPALRYPE